MGTPKKTVKKKLNSKSPGAKNSADESTDPKERKRIIDDEDEDEDFDIPLDDDLGRYESFEGYEEDDDY